MRLSSAHNTFIYAQRDDWPDLPSKVSQSRIAPEQSIPDTSPFWLRVGRTFVRLWPVTWVSRVNRALQIANHQWNLPRWQPARGRNQVDYGQTSRKTTTPVDEHTLFEIGSVTKVFTSTLLADLAQANKVDLHDSVQAHLPPHIHVPTFHGQSITLAHLASHTSGLPSTPTNLISNDGSSPFADYSPGAMPAAQIAFTSCTSTQYDRTVSYPHQWVALGREERAGHERTLAEPFARSRPTRPRSRDRAQDRVLAKRRSAMRG